MSGKIDKQGTSSRIIGEIDAALRPVSMNGAGAAEATFSFGEDFSGFQGHFPAKKVLPGVCQIQCVLALLGRWQDTDARLREITNVKYVLPVFPGDVVTCKIISLKELGDGLFNLKASMLKGTERVSDFRLKAWLGRSGR